MRLTKVGKTGLLETVNRRKNELERVYEKILVVDINNSNCTFYFCGTCTLLPDFM